MADPYGVEVPESDPHARIAGLEEQIEALERECLAWKQTAEYWREQAAARTVPGE